VVYLDIAQTMKLEQPVGLAKTVDSHSIKPLHQIFLRLARPIRLLVDQSLHKYCLHKSAAMVYALKIPYRQPKSAASKAGAAITSLARLTGNQTILTAFTASMVHLIQGHAL
jgi:hypothetical protein